VRAHRFNARFFSFPFHVTLISRRVCAESFLFTLLERSREFAHSDYRGDEVADRELRNKRNLRAVSARLCAGIMNIHGSLRYVTGIPTARLFPIAPS